VYCSVTAVNVSVRCVPTGTSLLSLIVHVRLSPTFLISVVETAVTASVARRGREVRRLIGRCRTESVRGSFVMPWRRVVLDADVRGDTARLGIAGDGRKA